MSLIRHISYINLFVILASLQVITGGELEDIVNEYYTTTTTETTPITDQDTKDAQVIFDSGKNEAALASILLYREKNRRKAINAKIWELIGENSDTWITQWYNPISKDDEHSPFMDLCFGLIEHENVVLGRYLNYFGYNEERAWFIIAMVLTRDMVGMIEAYETNTNDGSFKELRKIQKKPFENLLRVWVRHPRDPAEKKLDKDSIKNDNGNNFNLIGHYPEYNKGCWHEYRDQIELITMRKSIPYAREVFKSFEMSNGNKTIESIIESCEKSHQLDHDLANAYFSLVCYIKDRHSYIACTLHDNCDESMWWAAFVMSISVVHPPEWSKINAAFQNRYKSEATSLSDFIMKKLTQNKVLAEAMAVAVDAKFKPTLFKERTFENDIENPFPAPSA